MMLNCSVQELAHMGGAELICEGSHITGDISIDSRTVEEGQVFLAFVGEQLDGNAFVADALQKGAACVVVSKEPSEEIRALAHKLNASLMRAQNDDCEEFLLRLAHARITAHPEWLVCGITGSVGKTTTKEMTVSVMKRRFKVHATKGNYNSLIGMPLTVLSAPDETQVLVLEMGMNHPREIARMSLSARPHLAAITNIGSSHIGFFGSQEGIATAKGEIVEGMRSYDGTKASLVLSSEDAFSSFIEETLATPKDVDVVYVGSDSRATLQLIDEQIKDDGCIKATVLFGQTSFSFTPKIPGKAAVQDALLALELGLLAQIPLSEGISAIEATEAFAMRMNVKKSPSGVTVIDDSYNASPASMKAALEVLDSIACLGKRIAVLGEMGELGQSAQELHEEVGRYAAASKLDLLVCVGTTMSEHMAASAHAAGLSDDKIMHVETIEELKRSVLFQLEPNDCVLVKASRSANLDVFAKEACSL